MPISFMSRIGTSANTKKTPTITIAALVTTPAVVVIPCSTASSVDALRSYASRTRLRRNT
jgi:hypothetical protein